MPGSIDFLDRTDFEKPMEKKKVDGVLFFFQDTPGQQKGGNDPNRIKENMITAAKKQVSGIINVVACGYHETKYQECPSFVNGQPPKQFLDECLTAETKALAEWGQKIGHEQTLSWVFTVMNKADLWWSRFGRLREYYEAGEYQEALNIAQHVNHIILPYASEHKRFWDQGYMDPEFDDKVRMRLRNMFLSNLLQAIGR